jgi:hypothetical protein
MKAAVVLEYLKVFLSSQVIVGVVVIVFVVIFRPALTAVIAGMLSLEGPGGLKATFDTQRQAAEESQKVIQETQPRDTSLTPSTGALAVTGGAPAVDVGQATPAPAQAEGARSNRRSPADRTPSPSGGCSSYRAVFLR